MIAIRLTLTTFNTPFVEFGDKSLFCLIHLRFELNPGLDQSEPPFADFRLGGGGAGQVSELRPGTLSLGLRLAWSLYYTLPLGSCSLTFLVLT